MEYVKRSKKSRPATGSTRNQASTYRKRRNTGHSSRNAANEVFHFGQHRGQTFWQVAEEDPSYHLRYKDMDDSPNDVLDRYIEWFNQYAPTRFEAHQAHRDIFGMYLGIVPPDLYGYDSDDEPY